MIERAGLNVTFTDKSKNKAITDAIITISDIPVMCDIPRMCGSAKKAMVLTIPPIIINGRRLPPINQTLSLTNPTIICPKIPATGPASHTNATSSIFNPYLFDKIQLSAAIWVESANPTAVAGSASKARNGLLSFF